MGGPDRRTVLRGLSAGAVAALAGLGAAGCGSSRQVVGPAVGDPDFGEVGSGTIRFWARSDTSAVPTALVEAFNSSQSDIRVELTLIPGAQQVTKIATAIRGDGQPDVFAVDDFYGTTLTYYGALTDLSEPISRLDYIDALSPGMLGTVSLEGRRYGLPLESDLSGCWYNKRLFERADLDPDQPPTSFEKVVSAARAVQGTGGGVSGFSFAGNCPGCLNFSALPSVWAGGSHLVEGDPGDQRANLAGNEDLRAILTDYRTLWADGLSTGGSRTQNGSTWGADFRQDTVGLFPGGYGQVVGQVPDSKLDDYGLFPLPGPTGGKSTFVGGDVITIPAGATNPSAAWKFIRFCLEQEQQLSLPPLGFTPVRSDVLTDDYRSKYPLNAVLLGLQDVGYIQRTVAGNQIFNQPSGAWPAMFTEAVFSGNVDGAIRTAQSAFSSALAEVNT